MKSIKSAIYNNLRSFVLLLTLGFLCSHNLYIKFDTYFLFPNDDATFSLYNGTFETSENIISRDRIIDASIFGNGQRIGFKDNQWKDKDSTVTYLEFKTGEAGTYVAGVSTKPKTINLTADKFNNYLKHDGLLDMLKYREDNNMLDKDAVESYEKHVKAIYQVGDIKTDDWKTEFGYPIEFIPLENPYEKYTHQSLKVKLFFERTPLANQLVYVDYVKTNYFEDKHNHDHKHDDEKHSHTHDHGDKTHSHEHEHDHNHGEHENHDHDHSHHEHNHSNDKSQGHKHDHNHDSHDHDHTHSKSQQLRTNAEGIVTVDLPEDGIYYLRTIKMNTVNNNEELTHVSKWATLTFEVIHNMDEHGHDHNHHNHDHGDHHHAHDGHDHDHEGHDHDHHHDHEHEDGLPLWVFVLGSIAIIGVLFLVFRKKD